MIGWILGGLGALGVLWLAVRQKPVGGDELSRTPPWLPPPTPPFELKYTQEYNPGEHGPPYLSSDVVILPGTVYEITFYVAKGFSKSQITAALRTVGEQMGFTLTEPQPTGLTNNLTSEAVTEPLPSGRMKTFLYEEWRTQIMRTPTVTQITKFLAPTRQEAEKNLALMTVQASDNLAGKPPMGGMVWISIGWVTKKQSLQPQVSGYHYLSM